MLKDLLTLERELSLALNTMPMREIAIGLWDTAIMAAHAVRAIS